MFAKIPESFWTALVGAIFAVVGFVGKSWLDRRHSRRVEHAEVAGRLQQLKSLLDGSKAVFEAQQDVLEDLLGLLEENHREIYCPDGGKEQNMALCYPLMTEKERELQGIVRTYTEHSMKTLNEEILAWLRADSIFKCGIAPVEQPRDLAEELFALEIHLLLWQAKYKVWIPNHPEHALVYMWDENKHGLSFPYKRVVEKDGKNKAMRGVDAEVGAALEGLRAKWKLNAR